MAIMGVNAQIQTTWLTSGNSATSHYFLGSTDSSPIKFRTSNTERMCISALGNIGIGSSALTRKGGTKRYEKVVERVGRARERYPWQETTELLASHKKNVSLRL